jgi:hypothetical protein
MEEALPKDLLRRMVAPTDGKKKALLWKEHQYLEPNKLKPWEDIWPSIDHCLKSFDRFLIPLNIPLAAQRGYHWGHGLLGRIPPSRPCPQKNLRLRPPWGNSGYGG